ncbi:MAG TPA: TPM domain-containing protein [Tepidisphaeraceae bacterium]
MQRRLWMTLALVLTAAMVALAPAPAALANRGINDAANFFSPQAEQRANGTIDDIYRNHHGQEVYIETAQATPDGQNYDQWAAQKTTQARVNGVYVLIVRKGGHVHVAADRETSRLFTDTVRRDLAERFRANLAKGTGNFDNALADALQFISDTFNRGERQPGGTAAPPPPSRGGGNNPSAFPPVNRTPSTPRSCGALPSGLFGWICLIVGVWIVFGLIRSVFRGRRQGFSGPGYGGGPGPGYGGPGYGGYGGGGYGPGPGYGGGGGGGWGSSILGGLFGAAAGNFIYDRMFRGGGTSYGQSPPMDTGGGYSGGAAGPSQPDWAGPGDTGSGFQSTDAGGGADFGGGGGDVGGGGGDFGGGGGDFGGGGGGDFGGGGSDAGGGGDFA